MAAAGGGRAALCFSADGLVVVRGPLAPTFRIYDADHFVSGGLYIPAQTKPNPMQ